MTDYRIEQIAKLADPALAVKLPAAVTHAITGYQACQQARIPEAPQQTAQSAIVDQAASLAEDALSAGRPPAAPDPAKIAAAREREQADLDTAAIAVKVRAAAEAALGRITDENRADLFTAIRARHQQMITELTAHARQLPPGADYQMALQQGGAIREHYLAAADLATSIGTLRELFRFVQNAPASGPVPGLMELAVTYLRTPFFYDTREDTSGTTRWGAYGSLPFYLGACREVDPGDWWLPTAAERDDLADAIHEQRRVEKVRASAQ